MSHQLRSMTIHKEVWVPGQSEFTFREQVDPTTGAKRFILKGLMLPFGKVSRNNVLYNKESIQERHKELINRPLMYNHKVEDNSLPKGHFINSYCKEDGWYYEADVDPAEKDLIRKLERGDLRHVSIQLIGGRVEERYDQNSGRSFTEAFVSDIIEGSIVPAPGFLDTTAAFAEAFSSSKKEDVSTSTAGGAIGGPLMPEDEEKEGAQVLFPLLKQAYPEEDDKKLAAVALVAEELISLSLDDIEAVKAGVMAESFIQKLGPGEVERIMKEEENTWRT